MDTHDGWGIAIHEASHAVIALRNGGRVKYINVIEEDDGESMGLAGNCLCIASPSTRRKMDEYLVAGYFAKRRWANGTRDTAGSDFNTLSHGRTPEEARRAWGAAMRRLSALARRDPTFESDVKAVAWALINREKIDGCRWMDGFDLDLLLGTKRALKAQAAGE